MLTRVWMALVFCAIARSAPPDSPLFQAIRNNDLPLIQRQLKDGADVNFQGRRNTTPLMYAAAFGTVDAMRLLIDAGADVNAKNAFDATALMWGAADLAKVKLLIDKGSGVNATSKQGRTALIIAASHNGAEPIVRLLVAKGADPKTADNFKDTPLIAAAEANDADSIRFLLEKGVDVNARDQSGATALMTSAGHGNLAVVRLLLKAGANINAVTAPGGPKVKAGTIALGKFTALLLAATYGSPELIKTLLDAGADVNATDMRGMTPLMMSVSSEYQRPEVVRLLLARGAALKATSLAGETAGDWAAKFGNPAVMSLFKDTGAKTDPPDAMTDAMVCNVASQQQADGRWHSSRLTNVRAPMQDGDISATAKDILALREFGFPGRKTEFDQRIDRARKWLTAAVPKYNEDRAFQLLGLKWAGAEPDVIGKLAKELMAEQRPDGGWSQNAYLSSDAYATGQTLYALNQAAGLQVSDQAYARGIDYLLKMQLGDGSWHVKSRGVKFQPYFQSGFPHDHDQWISSAGTAWSAAALALGLPVVTAAASR